MNTPATFSLTPQTLDEAMKMAELMANSDMVPKDYKGRAGNVLVAVQMGAEVGLPPMQAIQNIAVINGRPALWGDAIKAVVLGSSLCQKFEEGFDEQAMTAWVKVQRKNHSERIVTFSQADAQKAGLWGKQGPWTQYPKRMLQMRARAFAARDEFADVLKGLSVAEEIQDIPQEKEINPVPAKATPPQLEYYPQDDFEKYIGSWQALIESGKRDADYIIKTAESKAPLTEEQKQILRDMEVSA